MSKFRKSSSGKFADESVNIKNIGKSMIKSITEKMKKI